MYIKYRKNWANFVILKTNFMATPSTFALPSEMSHTKWVLEYPDLYII